MLLMVRIITRGAYEPDEEEQGGEGENTTVVKARDSSTEATGRMRRILCDYVLGDFANRFVNTSNDPEVFLTTLFHLDHASV